MVILISLFAFTVGLMIVVLMPYMAKLVEVVVNSIPKTGWDTDLSEGAINKYRQMGVVTLASPAVLCVKRTNGGFDWVSAKRDGNELVAQLNGEEKRWGDPLGNAGRLYGKVFGIVHEDNNILLSPSDLAVAERYVEKKARDEEVVDLTESPFGKDRAWYGYTSVPKMGGEYVNADIFPGVVRGNCDPRAGIRTEEFVKKMYQNFNSTAILDKLIIIGAFPVGVGIVYLLWKLLQASGTGGGGGGVSVPIGFIGGVLF